MHLYPARLGSASPASVARRSLSLASSSFPLYHPPPPPIPVLHQVLLLSFVSLFRSLSLPRHEIAPRTFGRSVKKEEEEEEARSYRRRRVPVVRFFSPTLSRSRRRAPRIENDQKDQVHPAEMHSRFPMRICDKNVTLLERCGRPWDRFVNFDSASIKCLLR